ncbi:MAG: hypothetical protein KA941_01540 [Flavobacteriales bacterium]|nr:hypothetical protein [Flavobacteriales bacterium]
MFTARTLSLVATTVVWSHATWLPAQNSYLFEVSPSGVDPYIELTADTPVEFFAEDGWHTVAAPPQLPIWLFGTEYNMAAVGAMRINRNGHVRFGNTYTFAELSIARTPMEPIDGTSRVSYQHFNGPGGGILVVQFKNLRLLNGINGNYMNAQLWYYATTGMIKMHYGPSSASNGSGFAGDRGPHIGVYHTPTDLSACLERVWLSGSPDGPQVSYDATYEFPALSGLPYEGTAFRFAPMFNIPEGIEENEASPFRMQSNLVSERLLVDVVDPAGTMLSIADASGRIIRTVRTTGGMNTLELGDLAPGSYLIISTFDGPRHAMRFVKV